jgi:hypothetical protein
MRHADTRFVCWVGIHILAIAGPSVPQVGTSVETFIRKSCPGDQPLVTFSGPLAAEQDSNLPSAVAALRHIPVVIVEQPYAGVIWDTARHTMIPGGKESLPNYGDTWLTALMKRE